MRGGVEEKQGKIIKGRKKNVMNKKDLQRWKMNDRIQLEEWKKEEKAKTEIVKGQDEEKWEEEEEVNEVE